MVLAYQACLVGFYKVRHFGASIEKYLYPQIQVSYVSHPVDLFFLGNKFGVYEGLSSLTELGLVKSHSRG